MDEMAETLSQEIIDEFVVEAHSDLDKVKAMLARHPGLLNESASWVETALEAAAHTGSRAIAEFLLGQGAPLDICTAAMLGRQDTVAAMLAETPDLIRATGAHHIPLLYYPAISGNQAIAEMLVEQGADVNAGAGSNTALHGAAGFGQIEMVRWLLDQGADFAAFDHEGKTPLDVADDTGHTEIAALLRAHSGME